MSVMVTGLSPTADVAALRAALGAAGLETGSLLVVEPGDEPETGGIIGGELLTDARRSVMNLGESGDRGQGTGVPGLTGYRPMESLVRPGASDDRLAELGIREDEMGNYVEALGRGRAVVGFAATPETADRVEALFREQGILNVRLANR